MLSPQVANGGEPLAPRHSGRLRRQHGFQPPLNPLQVVGWLTLAALAGGSYLVLVPALPPHAQPAAAAALSVLLLVHISTHLSATLVDPAEEALRSREPKPVPLLDRTKHSHVIEGGVCHLCHIQVTARTKHCSACNKCVANFDHHCKWLNHCIGGRNYSVFLMCVSSAIAAAVLVFALAVANLVYHHTLKQGDEDEDLSTEEAKDYGPPSKSNVSAQVSSSLPSSDAAFLAIVAALGLLAAITAGLLLHLCFFHIYISFLGLTTYEYIRQQRQSRALTRDQHAQDAPRHEQENGYINSTLRHRPVNLQCDGRTRTTFFSCTVLEETFSSCNTEPTPTPPTTPQDCQMCIINNNAVAPEAKVSLKKVHRKWNCCVSVPDSPDDPNSPSEPRCLMSLCRHKAKSKKLPSALEGRPHRTHGHWSSAKLRMLFRVLGNLGQHRRRNQQQQQHAQAQLPKTNQIVPLSSDTGSNDPSIRTINNLVPVADYPDASYGPNAATLPRRRVISETELANALTLLQQQQQQQRCGRRPSYRRKRRSVVHRPKTPALSPIRESGLSNPASPSRQTCTVSAISGSCTRPL
ncbi:palmitoyltransferase ZDHHC11 [Cylas formicarius]|uniref:palmitoyltransferase ZDHHC11 n=1 Tax=Cylas formicarius TaxID=197179 RepID=UPI0029588F98|nr:palmitoyltransferase ZDHHC11 [Cylas formicarius]